MNAIHIGHLIHPFEGAAYLRETPFKIGFFGTLLVDLIVVIHLLGTINISKLNIIHCVCMLNELQSK